MEAQEQTKALVEMIRKNPDVDYTEGGLQIYGRRAAKEDGASTGRMGLHAAG
ncbi:hypothetical protein WDD9_006539 [Paenibacillus melissococcoides]|uniref:hypothetical protein n=1 Tax=Paenibacillus melissococcoides TaxID=2912268 RepID=UPI0021C2CFD5|nr:hypothetical protein [Paenibacillus melissococcoides]CAH8721937.1 hypothetical protein WDD9_006539 [Paenibacillus melissococcoides]